MHLRNILLMSVFTSIIATCMLVVMIYLVPTREPVVDIYKVISSETTDSQSIFGTSHTYYLIVQDKNGNKKTYEVSADEYFTANETGVYTRETLKE